MEEILDLIKQCEEEVKDTNIKELEEIKNKYLSKKGIVSVLMSKIKDIPPLMKKEYGLKMNELNTKITEIIETRKELLDKYRHQEKLLGEKIDVTLSGNHFPKGSLHLLSIVALDLEDFFISQGFEVKDGPEMESEYYNFEAMNIGKNHPARGEHDSFFLDNELLLRTHTSPVQARTMEEKKGEPFQMVCLGKTYRRDNDDFSHSHQFMQIEGLVVGKGISLGNLKDILLKMFKHIFKTDKEIMFRPSYFPFTEPSVEVDVLMKDKNGEDYYLEILGAGMVHKDVLKMGGYDPNVFSGFAFGVGIERIAIIKYGIDTIKQFYQNDLRFIKQFRGESK
jgi:phenylalanyl-tRNA synthetase alpha chain